MYAGASGQLQCLSNSLCHTMINSKNTVVLHREWQTHSARKTDPARAELGHSVQDSCWQANLELLGVHPATWSAMSFYNDNPMTLCLQLPGSCQSCKFSTDMCCCLQMPPTTAANAVLYIWLHRKDAELWLESKHCQLHDCFVNASSSMSLSVQFASHSIHLLAFTVHFCATTVFHRCKVT